MADWNASLSSSESLPIRFFSALENALFLGDTETVGGWGCKDLSLAVCASQSGLLELVIPWLGLAPIEDPDTALQFTLVSGGSKEMGLGVGLGVALGLGLLGLLLRNGIFRKLLLVLEEDIFLDMSTAEILQ